MIELRIYGRWRLLVCMCIIKHSFNESIMEFLYLDIAKMEMGNEKWNFLGLFLRYHDRWIDSV